MLIYVLMADDQKVHSSFSCENKPLFHDKFVLLMHIPEIYTFQNNKENFGPPPYPNPPRSGLTSRQSEPILPQPPLHHPSRPVNFRRDVFPDRLSTSSSYARLQPHHGGGGGHHGQHHQQPHSLDYYQLPSHNDSNFSNDGFLPSLQEADRYFGVSDRDDTSFSSNSRLSLGMRYHTTTDPMYETLSQYRSSDTNSNAGGGQGGQRRWSNTNHQRFMMRRDPPPLPPKPRLPPVPPHALRSTQSDVGMPPSRGHHNDRGHHPRDSGYSVSFV